MIYIQKNNDNIPHHFDCASAMYGAIESGLNYRLIAFEDVQFGRYDTLIRDHLFVGSVEFMREVFKRVGIENPRVPKNSNRKHELMELKEAHNRVAQGETLFIKPYEIKLFTGLILDGCQHSCLQKLPEDTKVMVYKPFTSNILSECRVYVWNGKIEDVRNYSGDVMLMPSREYIENVIKEDCVEFPIAYTIDVALLEDGSNVVVEFNDMWAIGNYGVPNDIYLRMLKKRYFEIIRK